MNSYRESKRPLKKLDLKTLIKKEIIESNNKIVVDSLARPFIQIIHKKTKSVGKSKPQEITYSSNKDVAKIKPTIMVNNSQKLLTTINDSNDKCITLNQDNPIHKLTFNETMYPNNQNASKITIGVVIKQKSII